MSVSLFNYCYHYRWYYYIKRNSSTFCLRHISSNKMPFQIFRTPPAIILLFYSCNVFFLFFTFEAKKNVKKKEKTHFSRIKNFKFECTSYNALYLFSRITSWLEWRKKRQQQQRTPVLILHRFCPRRSVGISFRKKAPLPFFRNFTRFLLSGGVVQPFFPLLLVDVLELSLYFLEDSFFQGG